MISYIIYIVGSVCFVIGSLIALRNGKVASCIFYISGSVCFLVGSIIGFWKLLNG